MLAQTIAQLLARAFTYACLLLLLPSFLAISTPSHYADIVLIATLAALAAQFDGGNANDLLITLATPSIQNSSPHHIRKIIGRSLLNTLLWSTAITIIFLTVWTFLSPEKYDAARFTEIFICGLSLACTCAFTNTISKVIFALPSRAQSIQYIPISAAITAALLLLLRLQKNTTIVLIVATFLVGSAVLIIASFQHIRQLHSATNFNSKQPLKQHENNNNKRWLFAAQIISIVLTAKNPVLVRKLAGDHELALFSVCSAIYSIILSPAASAQIPLMRRFAVAKSSQAHMLIKPIVLSILLTFLISIATSLTYYHLGHIIFGKNVRVLNAQELWLVSLSALVACICVIITSWFIAQKRYSIVLKTALIVVVTDLLLVFLSTKWLGGPTPIYTILFSNLASIMYCISKIRNYNGT